MYTGPERRSSERFDFTTPLNYKICRKKTINLLLMGYTSNVSRSGLLCRIKDKVKKGDILWLSFDRDTLKFCKDLEKTVFIYQNGIIAQVVRITPVPDGLYEAGVRFLTREEKNLTNIYPKIHFLKDLSELDKIREQEEEEAEE